MKQVFVRCLIALLFFNTVEILTIDAADALSETSPRSQVDLTGPWLFWPDKKNEGAQAGCFSEQCDDSGWRQVEVPVAFDRCGHDLERYSGIGWFRRTVKAPLEMKDRRVVLHFAGISYNAIVWVNGKQVGKTMTHFCPSMYWSVMCCVTVKIT
jgi:beta-galactosidase/beta-glucuronidase